jgi:hypothetical protein
MLAAYIQVSRGVGALDLDIVAVSHRQVFLADLLSVDGSAAVVVIATVLAVQCVPGVRQIDKIPLIVDSGGDFGGLLSKCPFAVDIKNCSQNGFLLYVQFSPSKIILQLSQIYNGNIYVCWSFYEMFKNVLS